MLGPRKRFDKMQNEFRKDGLHFSTASLERVHAPIGLDVGAETPDEIALSIMAEIKAFFTKGAGSFLKDKSGPIHERLSGNSANHRRQADAMDSGAGYDALGADAI